MVRAALFCCLALAVFASTVKSSSLTRTFLSLNASHVSFFNHLLSMDSGLRERSLDELLLLNKPVVSFEHRDVASRALRNSLLAPPSQEAQQRLNEIRIFLVDKHELFNSTHLKTFERYSQDTLFPRVLNSIAQLDASTLMGGSSDVRFNYRAILVGLHALQVGYLNMKNSRSKHQLNHFSFLDREELHFYKGLLPIRNSTDLKGSDVEPPKSRWARTLPLMHLIRSKLQQSLATENEQSEKAQMEVRQNDSWTRDLPTNVNWLERGAVGEVLQQGHCGSCWAFAATAVLRSRLVAAGNGNMTLLSNQQVVSCAIRNGCSGGFYTKAWSYAKTYGGIAGDASYPYTSAGSGSVTPPCDTSIEAEVVTTQGMQTVLSDEQAVMHALAAGGPLAVAIATPKCFDSYAGGILMMKDCECYPTSESPIDHAVTLIGYGTSEDGIDYWLVQNSWGANWGQHGYVMLQRGIPGLGMCGILSNPAFPSPVTLSVECQKPSPPSYCSASLQKIRYTNLNMTSGEPGDMCYANYGGSYSSHECRPADFLPIWAWVLIGIVIALTVVLVILLSVWCCEKYAPAGAWFNLSSKPPPEGQQLLTEEDRAQGKVPPVPNSHPNSFPDKPVALS